MGISVTVGFHPGTQALEAHCDECGALVATLSRDLQLESKYLSTHWFGLLRNGRQEHEGAGCSDHGAE